MNINIQEARRLIMLIVRNHQSAVHYGYLGTAFVRKMPDMIIGYGNKLMPLLAEMVEEEIIKDSVNGYIKGPNFPESF